MTSTGNKWPQSAQVRDESELRVWIRVDTPVGKFATLVVVDNNNNNKLRASNNKQTNENGTLHRRG